MASLRVLHSDIGTLIVKSGTCSVFDHPNIAIMGSKSTRLKEVCLPLFYLFEATGRVNAIGRSLSKAFWQLPIKLIFWEPNSEHEGVPRPIRNIMRKEKQRLAQNSTRSIKVN
jgi:hypothetical protein